MIKSYYKTFVSAQKAISKSDDEYNMYAFETEDKEYYVYYQKKGETTGSFSETPVKEEDLEFIGDKETFEEPIELMVKSEIVDGE